MPCTRWAVATPPTVEPITLNEARAHLREPGEDQNSLIQTLITAARQHIEKVCERALMTQTWRASWDAFPSDGLSALELPGGAVQSVTTVAYTDTAGAAQTIAPGSYQLDTDREPARMAPAANGGIWPATYSGKLNAVQVTYVAGYADTSKVPAAIKAALLLIVGDLFENREGQIIGAAFAENRAVKALLMPYKRVVP